MDIYINNQCNAKCKFNPIDKENITVYVCGPTVYNTPHIGNMRTFIFFDLVLNVLLTKYRKVTYIRNITDIDDKIINQASLNNTKCSDVSRYYIEQFNKINKIMNCRIPTLEPKVTDHINEIQIAIQTLIDNGSAYIKDGSVYFKISSYRYYGKLSGRIIAPDNELGSKAGLHNVEFSTHNSESNTEPDTEVLDFVLWKKKDNNIVDDSWESPWGKGRPGWHIECSTIATQYLGLTFDIHGGGLDLLFPHHENEIAQACCIDQDSHFANYWIHNDFVTFNNAKMSKSLQNSIHVLDLVNQNIEPNAIRYALISTYYRSTIDWSDAIVQNSTNIINKIKSAMQDYMQNVTIHNVAILNLNNIQNCQLENISYLNVTDNFANGGDSHEAGKNTANDSYGDVGSDTSNSRHGNNTAHDRRGGIGSNTANDRYSSDVDSDSSNGRHGTAIGHDAGPIHDSYTNTRPEDLLTHDDIFIYNPLWQGASNYINHAAYKEHIFSKDHLSMHHLIYGKFNAYQIIFIDRQFMQALYNDFNVPKAIFFLNSTLNMIAKASDKLYLQQKVIHCLLVLGFNIDELLNNKSYYISYEDCSGEIKDMINKRNLARQNKDFHTADIIRATIKKNGFEVIDLKDNTCLIKKI